MKIQIIPGREFRQSPDNLFNEETWVAERKQNLAAALARLNHEVVEEDPEFTIELMVAERISENEYPWTDQVECPVFMPGENTFTLVALNCNSRVDVSLMLDPVWNEQLENSIIEYFTKKTDSI
jgi:hypothetical protein